MYIVTKCTNNGLFQTTLPNNVLIKAVEVHHKTPPPIVTKALSDKYMYNSLF